MVDFDEILYEINDFGVYQRIRYFLICLAAMLPAIVTYLHSFIAANPAHRCAHPNLANDSFFADLNSTLYEDIEFVGKCAYKMNDTEFRCNSWVFDKTYYESTLTEDWNTVCDKSFWRGSVQTVYFSGYLFGSIILGVLSDRFGRRPIMFSSFILLIIGGCGAAFGPQKQFGTLVSYIIYTISRFLVAVGTRGINVTGFVLGMEIVGKSKRTFAGIVFEYFFAIGQLVLVALAYFIRDWRTLAWVAILPCVPFLSYYFFIPESPRWLVAKNRHDEALEILDKIAKANKRTLNTDSWQSFLRKESEKEDIQNESLISVFKSPILAVLTCTLFLNWIINNFVFYGVGLISNDLGANPYLTFAISAFMELLAYMVTHFLVDKFGRKIPYTLFLLLAGISCFSITFVSHSLTIVILAMIGKFCAAASYAIIYMYSTEMFPTSIRNSCMGACSMMARVGSMIAPQINNLGDIYWKPLPFFIFGVAGMLGSFTSFVFPETLNRPMPQSIAEAEDLSALKCMKKSRTNHKEDYNLGDE